MGQSSRASRIGLILECRDGMEFGQQSTRWLYYEQTPVPLAHPVHSNRDPDKLLRSYRLWGFFHVATFVGEIFCLLAGLPQFFSQRVKLSGGIEPQDADSGRVAGDTNQPTLTVFV